jgi:hypothetical protein
MTFLQAFFSADEQREFFISIIHIKIPKRTGGQNNKRKRRSGMATLCSLSAFDGVMVLLALGSSTALVEMCVGSSSIALSIMLAGVLRLESGGF